MQPYTDNILRLSAPFRDGSAPKACVRTGILTFPVNLFSAKLDHFPRGALRGANALDRARARFKSLDEVPRCAR